MTVHRHHVRRHAVLALLTFAVLCSTEPTSRAVAQECACDDCADHLRDGRGCCPTSACSVAGPADPAPRRARSRRGPAPVLWCPNGPEPSEASAAARAAEIEQRLVDFESAAIDPGRPETLDRYVSTVSSQIDELDAASNAIATGYDAVRAGGVCWRVSADVRAGRAYEIDARAILTTPFVMPADLARRAERAGLAEREEIRVMVEDRIRAALDARVRPVECLAITRYMRAMRLAREEAVYDEFTRVAIDRLQAYGDERIAECMTSDAARRLGLSAFVPGERDRARAGPLELDHLLDRPTFVEPTPEEARSAGAADLEAGSRQLAARDWDAARAHLERALARDASLVPAIVNIALLDARSEALRELATRALESLLATHPDDARVAHALAEVLVSTAGATAAARRLQDRRFRGSEAARVEAALLVASLGRARDAVSLLRSRAASPDARIALARVALRAGDPELARAAARDLPFEPRTAIIEAMIASATHRYSEHAALMRRVQERFPQDRAAVAAYALHLTRAGRAEEALGALDALPPALTSDPTVLLVRSESLRARGRFREALDAATRAEETAPLPSSAAYEIALALLEGRDRAGPLPVVEALERAREAFRRYQRARGDRLARDDASRMYLEEIERAIERERRRLEREAARRAREGRSAATSSSGGDVDSLLAGALGSAQAAPPRPPREAGPLPAAPTREQVEAALATVRSAVHACGGGQHGMVLVALTVAGSTGRVTGAAISGQFEGTPIGSCVARAVRGAAFPRFSQPTLTVNYPFRI